MTSSFQSTSGESFRRPVNTFVQPVTATQRSSLADLAEILEVVNPVLTVNPVTPIDIGLLDRTPLYNLPQLNRPNDIAVPIPPKA